MFEVFTIGFFGLSAFLFFGTMAAVATFLAVWNTYSFLYDQSGSFFVSFFSAFFVAIMIIWFASALLIFGIPLLF
jgi:hypothetical protein